MLLLTGVEVMKRNAVVEMMELLFSGDGEPCDGEIGAEYDGGDGNE